VISLPINDATQDARSPAAFHTVEEISGVAEVDAGEPRARNGQVYLLSAVTLPGTSQH
jgi:hypothetical protein